MSRRTTLFVAGINPNTRAKDLAYEFERYGRLVRCDIPAPRPHAKPYAFVEFESSRDAEDAYHEMHGLRIEGFSLNIQWARNAPSKSWRFERGEDRGGHGRNRSRSRSPRRSRSRSPDRGAPRSRSRSPVPRRGGSRSPSPRREADGGAAGDDWGRSRNGGSVQGAGDSAGLSNDRDRSRSRSPNGRGRSASPRDRSPLPAPSDRSPLRD
ncbi:hypothetical protein RI367_005964 [Sorochytrium milnesiophthora]